MKRLFKQIADGSEVIYQRILTEIIKDSIGTNGILYFKGPAETKDNFHRLFKSAEDLNVPGFVMDIDSNKVSINEVFKIIKSNDFNLRIQHTKKDKFTLICSKH